MINNRNNQFWTIAYHTLFACWVTGALLYMLRYDGGFLTNYLSDLTFPPWFYIFIRGLRNKNRDVPKLVFFGKWFGLTPERAAISIFVAGVASEFKTLIWPNGFITGRYDPYDILAYTFGLLSCYLIDKLS